MLGQWRHREGHVCLSGEWSLGGGGTLLEPLPSRSSFSTVSKGQTRQGHTGPAWIFPSAPQGNRCNKAARWDSDRKMKIS